MSDTRWKCNLHDAARVGARETLGLFQAGSAQAIVRGELLGRTGAGSTWVPVGADYDGTTTKLAIAGSDIAAGDLAGYYPIVEILPGDVFEFELDVASAILPETALYTSSSTVLSESGTNVIGYVSSSPPNSPLKQNRMSEGDLGDNGSTFRSTKRVWVVFRESVSYHSLIQRA